MTHDLQVSYSNLERAFERMARLATTFTPAERVGLLRREGDQWHWEGGYGLEPPRSIPASTDTLVTATAPRVERQVPGTDPVLQVLDPDAQSYASVPVVVDEATWGVLFVTASAPEAVEEEITDPLAELAGLLGEGLASSPRAPDHADSRHYEFLENIPVGVYRSTPEGRILYANSSLAHLLGFDSVEALTKRDLNEDGFAEDNRATFKELMETQGEIVQNETVWTRADGSQVHVLESARAVRDEEGAVQYYEGVVENITERKQAEHELRVEKNFIDSAMDSLPGAFYLIDSSFQFRRWNQKLEEVTGYTKEEIRELNPLGLFVEEDRGRVADSIRAVFEKGQATVEATIQTKHGDKIPFFLTGAKAQLKGQLHLVGMGIDISKRKAAEEALKEAKEEAEEMNRLKSVFLANMSHEIRTPLTSILGFADILSEKVEGEASHLVDMIHESGSRLKETLTSVLELARLERKSSELETESCDLAERVEETLELMQPQVASNDLELQFELPSEPVFVQADPGVLHRVLTNLVSNAIKFTEEGTIRVTVAADADEAILKVSDTGIGISDEFMDQIFDEFRQESEGLTRAHEGSGLGLTITHRLVELMGGSIDVESTKGEGSTFTVRLPREGPQQKDAVGSVAGTSSA